MAAKKTIAQLSADVLKLETQLKTLNAQIALLPKNTEAFNKALASQEEIYKKAKKAGEELSKSSSTLTVNNVNHKASIEQSNKALNSLQATLKKTESFVNSLATAEKKASEQKRKDAESILKKIEADAIKEFNIRKEAYNKRKKQEADAAEAERKQREAQQKEKLRQEEANQKKINKILSDYRKEAEREATKQAKSNDFFGSLRGSFTPEKLGSTLGTVTRFLGIGSAVFAVVDGLKQLTVESVRVFAQLEKGFAQLSAVAGATTEQMRLLQKQTFDVAASTGYTTSEIIELQTNLVKLGIPIQDVSSSIQGIAVAAKAMGVDLSQVGEAVFRVSNQFGLGASEASVTAAILTRAVNESALTFDEFGTAIQYVGPVAKQAGLSFRETAGYMQILSDAGFKASKIGTGLRDIFIDLKQPGESLSQTILRLSKENIGLSEAVDLVGKTSASQFLVLLRNAEIIEQLSSETYNAKMATEDLSKLLLQTAKNMSTVSANVASLSTAWESYQFGIGGAIAKTEILLDILDELDSKAAQTARAYKAIQFQSEERVQGAIGFFQRGRRGAAVNQLALPNTLGQLDDRQEALLDRYFNAGMDAQKLSSGDQILLFRLMRQEQDAVNELIGVYRLIEEQVKAIELEREAISIRNMQRAKYQVYLDSVEAASGQNKIDKADKLNRAFYAEELRLKKKLTTAKTEEDKRQVELQIQAQKDLSSKLDELVSGTKDQLEEDAKAEDKRLKAQNKALDEEYKRLKETIETRKEDYKQKVESLELEKQLAQETGDLEKLYQIDLQLISERVKAYAELTKNIDDSKIATADQKDELKDSLDVFRVNNKDLSDSVEEVSKVFKKFLELNPQGPSSIASPEFFDKFIEDYISGLEKAIGTISEQDRERLRLLLQAKLGEAFGANAVSENPTPDGGKGGRKKKPGIDSEDFKEELKKLANDAASALSESIEVIRDAAFDNLIGKLNAEKDAIQERYDFEDKVLRSQLDSQLITQEEYERKLESIKKKKIQSENAIQKKIFEAEKKRDRQNAGLAVAEAIASLAINNFKKFDTASGLILTGIGAAIAGAQYAAQLSAINQRQFFPTRFAEGGVVNGPSHAEGGVPFTVKGRGGYEMEGGEFIVNKEATKRNYSLLRQINDSVKPSKYSVGRKFAAGGMVNAEEISVRQIELLENIAYATGTTSINTAKPVRAFVSSDDLRKSDVDLRVKERNSNL